MKQLINVNVIAPPTLELLSCWFVPVPVPGGGVWPPAVPVPEGTGVVVVVMVTGAGRWEVNLGSLVEKLVTTHTLNTSL